MAVHAKLAGQASIHTMKSDSGIYTTCVHPQQPMFSWTHIDNSIALPMYHTA